MRRSLLQWLIPVMLLLISQRSDSQSYHFMPVSDAQWNVARCWFFYPGGWHDEYALMLDGTDTIYNGRIYKKILIQTHHAPGTEYDSTYTHYLGGMRESNKQVFIISEYQCLDTIERMVYDFNATQPGDTIYTQILTNGLTQFIPHIVVSLDSIIVGSEYHRRINLRDENDFFTESWTEGLGSSLGLTYASYWLLTDNSYDLTCFYDQGALKYTNPQPQYAFCSAPLPDIQCALTTGVKDIPKQQDFTIFPNPAFDDIIIDSRISFHSIAIINELGERIMSCGETYTVAVNSFLPGLYFIQFRDTNNKLLGTVKLVKL